MSWDTPTAEPSGWDQPTTEHPTESGVEQVTNDLGEVSIEGQGDSAPTGVPNAEAVAKAVEHGWVQGAKLDYDAFTTPSSQPKWASDAEVYEWTGDEGEIGARNEALEDQLFNDKNRTEAGSNLQVLQVEATVEGPSKTAPILKFEDAGLHPQVLANVQACKYHGCTIVQAYCIPFILAGHDVVAVAQTGSGKTAAYMVPIVSKLMGKAKKLQGPRPNVKAPDYNPMVNRVRAEPLVVVVCPTRELAQQIFDEARRICYRSMLRPVCVYGGTPMGSNIQELSKGCDILIGTPGRLGSFMDKPDILSMRRVKFTVIDEADEMLHPDWEEAMGKIMGGGDTNEDADHRYLMFSATFPKESRKLAKQYMDQNFMRVRVGRAGATHSNITQDVVFVEQKQKKQALHDLLFGSEPCRTLIFCNSTGCVEDVDDYLWNQGLPTAFMHGKRSQIEREEAMRTFKSGKTPILISTNIFGRGIDVAGVNHVINYDLPSADYGGIDEYVHRIGRTGRIGHVGRATSFYNERNEDIASGLANLIIEAGSTLPDFLEQFKPEDGKAVFQDDTDDEEEKGAYTTEAAEGGDAWGSAPAEPAAAAASGWGTDAAAGPVAASGWGTDDAPASNAAAW